MTRCHSTTDRSRAEIQRARIEETVRGEISRFFSDRTSSSSVPLGAPALFSTRGAGRSSGPGLGGASEPQNTGRLHFAALRLLLIIYAASATPLPTPVAGTRVCWLCNREARRGETWRGVAWRGEARRAGYPRRRCIGIIVRAYPANRGPGEPGANPIESRNRFAR